MKDGVNSLIDVVNDIIAAGGCCQVSNSDSTCKWEDYSFLHFNFGKCVRLNGKTIGCERGVWKDDLDYDPSTKRCLKTPDGSDSFKELYKRLVNMLQTIKNSSKLNMWDNHSHYQKYAYFKLGGFRILTSSRFEMKMLGIKVTNKYNFNEEAINLETKNVADI